LLWAKGGSGGTGGGDVPVPELGRRVAAVKLTASNLADITLVDFVVWSLKEGSSGSVLANVGGELHSLYGAAAQAVTSSFSCTGKSLTITLGEGSTVREGQVAVGAVVPVALKASAGETELTSGAFEMNPSGVMFSVAFILPCRLADSRAVSFHGEGTGSYHFKFDSKPTGGTLTLAVSNLANKSVKWTPYSFSDAGAIRVQYSSSFDVSFTKSEINTRNSKDIAYRTGLTVSGLNSKFAFKYADPGTNQIIGGFSVKRKAVDLTVEMFISEIVYAD
jgi:hypothetical protein